jgi:uncharacterized membrane protein YdjX (TVP38/TMEM64 family)
MATLGATAGGYLTYRLAREGGEKALYARIRRRTAEKIRGKFEHRGFATVAAAALLPPPFPTFPVLLTAGVMQYPARKFLTALGAGRAVRYFAIGYLAHAYGRAVVTALTSYYRPVLYGLIALSVAAGVYLLIYLAGHRSRQGAHHASSAHKRA